MLSNQEIGSRIFNTRQSKGLTLDDIALSVGVAKSTIQRYEKGTIQKIKLPVLESIANALDVNPNWLIGNVDKPVPPTAQGEFPYNPTHRIPILGRISAGLPLYAEQHIEGYTYTELNHGGEYFALRVSGDSMTAARISEGDILIVRRQDIVENGEIAVIMVNGDEATVKRFHRDGDTVTLTPQSFNPEHQPQVYNIKKTPVRILGRVVQNQISY